MKRAFLLLTLPLLFILATGCKQKQPAADSSKSAKVSATPAYEKYFGPAPVSDKGNCFAFVIFFPSAKEPGKVVPFPFFTFDEGSIRKVAVERLLGGMDAGSYRGEFLQPFPTGTRILSTEGTQGTAMLTLSKEFAPARNERQAALAIAMTLRQFKGVSAVRLQVEGNNAPLDVPSDESMVLPPGPPRLLSVTAMRDKGAQEVEEVDVFFDRPVDVTTLKMMDSSGKPLEGDLYHSVFDMAAVLKPKEPGRFTAGTPVQVRWDVSDKLGRKSQGTETFPLKVREHAK